MKIKLFIIITIFLLFSFPLVASQEVDYDKAYNWLFEQQPRDIIEASLIAITISKIDSSKAQTYINYIKENKNPSQACWPRNCDPTSTAFVLLAMNNGIELESVTKEEVVSWLELNQIPATFPGKWFLQIITQGQGTCTLTYAKQGQTSSGPQIGLTVNQGKISTRLCSEPKSLLDMRSCVSSDIFTKPSTQVRITCDDISDARISVVYSEASSYYLVSETLTQPASLIINNGRFTNQDATYYANWALKLSDSEVNSLLYLKRQPDFNSIKYLSSLYLISGNPLYLNLLESKKSLITASYGNNLWDNALAILALKQAGRDTSDTQTWLARQQNTRGSWQDAKTTALILFALEGTAQLPECTTTQTGIPCGEFGVCLTKTQTCNPETKTWVSCNLESISDYSPSEICGDNLDNNCDGEVDEGCECEQEGATQRCGVCDFGTQTCRDGKWSSCAGTTTTNPEDWDNDGVLNSQDGDICTNPRCLPVWRPGDRDPESGFPILEEFYGKAKNDNDLDGICDGLDQCPNTFLGCQVNDYSSEEEIGCPADCTSAACFNKDPSCVISSCEQDCGAGIFNVCDYTECSELSSNLKNGCYFKSFIMIANQCITCSQNMDCSNYLDIRDCTSDPCNIGCELKDNICQEKPRTTYYKDNDQDGFGNPQDSADLFEPAEGYVENNGDCNDDNPEIKPGATEICDNKDNDCNNEIDDVEGGCACLIDSLQRCSLIQGVCQDTFQTCEAGTWSECNYGPLYQPAESNCYDSEDNDCDGLIDCYDSDCKENNDRDKDNVCDDNDPDKDGDRVNNLDTQGNILDREEWTKIGCSVWRPGDLVENRPISPRFIGVAKDTDQDGICDSFDSTCSNTPVSCTQVQGYEDEDPGCPSDCTISSCRQGPDTYCQADSCRDDCGGGLWGTGLFDTCSYQVCSILSDELNGCYFQETGLLTENICHSCLELDSCSDYYDTKDCVENDPCNIGPCEVQGEECVEITLYYDADGDGFPGEDTQPDSSYDSFRSGEVEEFDCNDNDSFIYPGADEICDNKDNDCDISTPKDANCACTPGTTQNCPIQESVCSQSCNAQGQWNQCDLTEASEEICDNEVDDNCNALIDCLDSACGESTAGERVGDWDNDQKCDKIDSDKDGDGIPNENDKEEWSPFGCEVNTFDPSELGKQLDSDEDGICDGVDQCTDTIHTCTIQDYEDLAPGCPSDCEVATCVADPACKCPTCADCISGTFDFCSQAECSVCAQGTCWFQPKDFAKDSCQDCSTATSCSIYLTQEDCNRNPCQEEIDNNECAWSSETCCIDNNENEICDAVECTSNWECGTWSTCTESTETQTRLCTDEENCGISCSDDSDCVNERSCTACTSQWSYDGWSICSQGVQERLLVDSSQCSHECPEGTTSVGYNRCKEERECGECTPGWECEPWSECTEGAKTRICDDKNDCGIICAPNEEECIETQLCTTDEAPESSCGNGICNQEEGENQASCPSDCEAYNPCIVDGRCEPQFGEDELNCAEDCAAEEPELPGEEPTSSCGDGFCDSNEDQIFCPADCGEPGEPSPYPGPEEEQGSRIWIFIVLIILLVLLIAAYFLFFKKPGIKKKPRTGSSLSSILPEAPQRKPLFGPIQKTPQQPTIPPPKRPRKTLVEDELEKSIKEAKKLLGK